MIPSSIRFLALLLRLLVIVGVADATNIGTFKDKTCSKSADNYRGPNGYPDGTCTPLHLSGNSSFSVVDIDRGCAGMYIHASSFLNHCSEEIDFWVSHLLTP